MAHLLQEEGFKVFVIAGGLRAWRKAGQPVEPVPTGDVIKLPMFQLTVPTAPAPAGATHLYAALQRWVKWHPDINYWLPSSDAVILIWKGAEEIPAPLTIRL